MQKNNDLFSVTSPVSGHTDADKLMNDIKGFVGQAGGKKKRAKKGSSKKSKKRQSGGSDTLPPGAVLEQMGGKRKGKKSGSAKKASSKKVAAPAKKSSSKKGKRQRGGDEKPKRKMNAYMQNILDIKAAIVKEIPGTKGDIPMTIVANNLYKDNDKNKESVISYVKKNKDAVKKMYDKESVRMAEKRAAKKASK